MLDLGIVDFKEALCGSENNSEKGCYIHCYRVTPNVAVNIAM